MDILKFWALLFLSCGCGWEIVARIKGADPIGAIGFFVLAFYVTRHLLAVMRKVSFERMRASWDKEFEKNHVRTSWPCPDCDKSPAARLNCPNIINLDCGKCGRPRKGPACDIHSKCECGGILHNVEIF